MASSCLFECVNLGPVKGRNFVRPNSIGMVTLKGMNLYQKNRSRLVISSSLQSNGFGPIIKFEEVMRQVNARGAKLPSDLLKAAQNGQLPQNLLNRYLDLQGSHLGFLMRWAMFRNRMLVDSSFLSKVITEVVSDLVWTTFAEYTERGEEFWPKFEYYVADSLVGIVVDIVLVALLAPYARIGQPSVFQGFLGRLQKLYADLPSSVCEAERPGCSFSMKQRIATFFVTGVLYALVGFGCGLIGQGFANMIMTFKRSIIKSETDVPLPPLMKSAAYWGAFLAVSSNFRYQVINGLERLLEESPLRRKYPRLVLALTFIIRSANSFYGGKQFVYWAKKFGIQ